MEIDGIIIGVLFITIIIMSNKLSQMRDQLYKLNKTLEKLALQMGVKELDYVDEDEVLESLKDLLKKGKKIEAIKEYRVATGESLKESKEKIDEFYEKLKVTDEI